MAQTLYVVTYCENENGGRAENKIIGVFDDLTKAREALDDTFHKACDAYGVEELNAYSYKDINDFRIEDEDQCYYEAFGEIVTTELHSEYFPVISLHRDDLKQKGFDADNLNDDTMSAIASRATDYLLDGDYWTCIVEAAMFHGIPRKED